MRMILLALLFGVSAQAGDVRTVGKSAFQTARNAYASTNVTTSAWVQVISATNIDTTEVEIFDSSGQTLSLGFGASGAEVEKIKIYPGGNGRIPLYIPQGTRVSLKSITATASSGEFDVNLYQ